MRPPEVPPEGPTLFYAIPPPGGTSGGLKGRGKRAEKIQKRGKRKLPPARFAALLRCPGAASKTL